MKIQFGAMAPRLTEQLRETGISQKELKVFDEDTDAITRLYVRGILSDREKQKAIHRLIKKIEEKYEAVKSIA